MKKLTLFPAPQPVEEMQLNFFYICQMGKYLVGV